MFIVTTFEGRNEVLLISQASNRFSSMFEGEKVHAPLVIRLQVRNLSVLRIKVIVGILSSCGLIGCQQLNEVDRCTRGNYVVRPARFAKPIVLLQLTNQILCSNRGALIPLVAKSNGAFSRLMLPEEYVSIIPEERCSILEKPIVRVKNFVGS